MRSLFGGGGGAAVNSYAKPLNHLTHLLRTTEAEDSTRKEVVLHREADPETRSEVGSMTR